MTAEKKIELTYKINKIKSVAFNIVSNPKKNFSNFTYQITVNRHLNINDKLFDFKIISNIFEDKGKTKKLAYSEVDISYNIVSLKDIVIEDKNSNEGYKMLLQFVIYFIDHALNITRGVIASESKDTFLEDSYLPLIQPTRFIQEEMKGIVK